jgi:hypothetical protein
MDERVYRGRCTRMKVATRPEQFSSGNLRKEENVLFLNFHFTEAAAIHLRKFRTSNKHLRKFRTTMKERSGMHAQW